MKGASVKPTERTLSWWPVLLLAALVCGISGCAARRVSVPAGAGIVNPPGTRAENIERLTRLHERRAAEGNDGEYVLGPGDVITLRAFDFEELNRQVRVDGNGTIALPLLETVPVGGRTVSAVQGDLTQRLGQYMYDPHVSVFVEEYRSQQVAVVGAVQRPGLVTLTGQHSSVLDAISAAGGMTSTAAGRIYLIPGEGRARADMNSVVDALQPGQGPAGHADLTAMAGQDFSDAMPLMLDSKEVPQGVETFFYSLPVRAGDVIMVQSSGDFIIEGWVAKPGTYPLRSGLTLRGALATAGGLAFPAKTSRVRIYRLAPGGETHRQEVNYSDIVAQRAPDVFVHEGDVIEVASSSVKLVPYGVYKMVTELVRFGAGIRMVP